jgi:hypothetical protein
MNKSDYKIVHKKPKDYENSTMSCNSSFDSSNSLENQSLSNLYIGYDQDKNKKFDNLDNNIKEDISNIDLDVNYIIANIYKLDNQESIKKGIIDYLNSKNYSESKKNAILIELKNRNNNNNIQQNIINQNTISNHQTLSNEQDDFDYSKIVINDLTEKNKWFMIVTIVLVIVIIIAFYIKLSDD